MQKPNLPTSNLISVKSQPTNPPVIAQKNPTHRNHHTKHQLQPTNPLISMPPIVTHKN